MMASLIVYPGYSYPDSRGGSRYQVVWQHASKRVPVEITEYIGPYHPTSTPDVIPHVVYTVRRKGLAAGARRIYNLTGI